METSEQELERLRAEVESYRQRELADLKSALAAVTRDVEHFRSEAYRNAELGRQIAREAQAEIDRLRAKLATSTTVDTALRRAPVNGRI